MFPNTIVGILNTNVNTSFYYTRCWGMQNDYEEAISYY